MNLRVVLIVRIVSLLLAGFTSFCQQAASQEQASGQTAALQLDVSDIAGAPGETIPMKISVTGAVENLYGFMLIRGIPDRFRLSSGFLNGNQWLISLADLETLRLTVPDDFEGRFDIEVTLILQGSEQRETQSASVAIQREYVPEDSPQLEEADLPPIIAPEPVEGVGQEPVKFLTDDEADAPETGATPFTTGIEPQPQPDPENTAPPDNRPTEQDVAQFCGTQNLICHKVCDLRSRNDFTGCPQRCESREARCTRTRCYKWTEPEFVIAGSFGGQQCLQ